MFQIREFGLVFFLKHTDTHTAWEISGRSFIFNVVQSEFSPISVFIFTLMSVSSMDTTREDVMSKLVMHFFPNINVFFCIRIMLINPKICE